MVPLRRDAQRNRARILGAARDLRDGGRPLQLNAVARMAEVGVGTVYRHFPTPDALAEGLVEHRFAELIDLAERASREPEPRAALRRFLERALGVFAADPAFQAAALGGAPSLPATAALRARLLEAFARLADAVAEQLRPGLDATDLLVLACGLGGSVRLRPDRAARYLDALLAGALV